ncbi:replication protein A 14 kDa subunit-like [Anneissia japonica]|uniref:replication protein A 14 kDa subunit-like n=1 Tax=Anneissia japonica TaxID=1529436 RepID=UPI0014257C7B|nr:replication protein A 14 kDa subunit-like [Anneissia japonica]
MAEGQANPRVNASMLPRYEGCLVNLLGKVKSVDQNGTSFVLTSTDNIDIEILLPESLEDSVEGITEVIGSVCPNPRQINCHQYVNHGDIDMDLSLYDEAVKLSHEHEKFFPIMKTNSDNQ